MLLLGPHLRHAPSTARHLRRHPAHLASDGIKSDLGKPLPAGNGKGQPPLPLLRNGKVVKRMLPDHQQSLVEIYTDEAVSFITRNNPEIVVKLESLVATMKGDLGLDGLGDRFASAWQGGEPRAYYRVRRQSAPRV